MSKKQWTPLHELAYFYYAFLGLAACEERHEDESHIDNRFTAIEEKISEWKVGDIDHDKLLDDVKRKVQKEIGSGVGKKVLDTFKATLTNVKIIGSSPDRVGKINSI